MRETKSRHQIDGYTPLFDELVREYDLQTAAVYGRTWRFCQMREGICYATVTRIAEEAGVSYKTAQRRLKTLCEEGYLEDLTPGLRNKPHRYKLTGKLDLTHLSQTKAATEAPSSDSLTNDSLDSLTNEGNPPPSSDSLTNEGSEEETSPSLDSLTYPSSDSLTNEETIRNNNNVVVGDNLTEEEQKAVDALLEIGFTPKSEAIRYARKNPSQTYHWVSFAKAEKSISNKPGFVRKRLDDGDDPPAVKTKTSQPKAHGGVFR